MKRASMGKQIMPPGKRKGPPPKRGPMSQGIMESPHKKMASGMIDPMAPIAMKKGGMVKKPKAGLMIVIGMGAKPKKGK